MVRPLERTEPAAIGCTPTHPQHRQVEHALATLYSDRSQAQPAEAWFRRAIGTFQAQRSSISNLDARLPFFENGSSQYLSYVEFLIRRGRTNAALARLDQSRGEILAEDLGVSSAGQNDLSLSSAANARLQTVSGTLSLPGLLSARWM